MSSHLELHPRQRPGGGGRTERWFWDFVVDGQSLGAAVGGDVAGVFGWGTAAWQEQHAAKLLARAPADVPPDRVMLYICPECGDLGCGAVTAAVRREGDRITWSDFRWERDWEEPDADGPPVPLGPFSFERAPYARALRQASQSQPGPAVAPIRAI